MKSKKTVLIILLAFALVLGGVLMLLHSINEIVNVLTGYEPENHEEVAA